MKDRVLSYMMFGVVVAAAAVIVSTIVVPNLLRAAERRRQKLTMRDMVMLSKEIESGKPSSIRDDHWGHPLQLRINGSHYLIRSAGSDGYFETDPAPVPPHTVIRSRFEDDILFGDGAFLQYPAGIGIGAKGPQAEAPGSCATCHPHHPAMAGNVTALLPMR
jgi:hypothetical protein